jgi:hypothetical protein
VGRGAAGDAERVEAGAREQRARKREQRILERTPARSSRS